MKTIPVETETVDMQTGASTKRTTPFMLLSPSDGACQTCGREHAPGDPHDVQQFYYQYAFYGEHGRWPTWADAVAHCEPDVKAGWECALRDMGKWSEPAP